MRGGEKYKKTINISFIIFIEISPTENYRMRSETNVESILAKKKGRRRKREKERGDDGEAANGEE